MTDLKFTINKANSLLNKLTTYHHTPLGPDFKTLTPDTLINDLCATRFCKKFMEPVSDASRKEKSIEAMLEYDRNGLTSFIPNLMNLDDDTRCHLFRARRTIHEIFSGFNLSFDSLGFPSGESYDSSNGDTSLIAKLRNINNWKITPECFDLFARICYNTRWLKKCAKAHFEPYSRRVQHAIYIKHGTPFQCFKFKLKRIVTFWYGSRLTTVPKNNTVERVIEIECMLNMICQRTIANSIRTTYENVYDINLLHAQEDHKKLISDPTVATIDFSNASNSVWLSLVRFMFPRKIYQLLFNTRAGVVSYQDTYYPLNMLSPMGNGYTFEVMTVLLTGIARSLDPYARVFGDDVIINNSVADKFIRTMGFCGWHVNESKTFINSKFRESCGAFFHDSIGYIRSFDFSYIEDEVDLMVCMNKIFVLHQLYPSSPFVSELKKVYDTLIIFIPALAVRTPQRCGDYLQMLHLSLNEGFYVTRSRYMKMRKSHQGYSLTKRQKKTLIQMRANFCDNTYNIIKYPRKSKGLYRTIPLDNVRSPFWIAYYLWNGRCVTPTRGKQSIDWFSTYWTANH